MKARGAVMGIAAALAAALVCAPPPAARAQSLEYSVKANYLARFAAFVQWPPGALGAASDPITVCVVGADPFGSGLETALAAQTVDGRRLTARRVASVTASAGCDIAYLAGGPEQSVREALQALRGAPVMTVTDEAHGGLRGAIHFTIIQNRVRFHIDERLAAEGRLTISSRLLALAVSVRARPQS